jgi:stage II sporulation protein D
MDVPVITVGILTAPSVHIEFHGGYVISGESALVQDTCSACASEGKIVLESGDKRFQADSEMLLWPQSVSSSFTLHQVTIGQKFHWERQEDQRFPGTLHLIYRGGEIAAVNVVSVEEYLASVIASEMRATSSSEFLKAQAITARSWLLVRLEASRNRKATGAPPMPRSYQDESKRVRWYDSEDHEVFDVCADDHCQRYHGLTKVTTSSVAAAVEATRGIVLAYEGEICDARYSKCCGGVTEAFENVWGTVHHPYLTHFADNEGAEPADICAEAAARAFIARGPEAYCNTSDGHILRQILPEFDQETPDFFRWRVEYTQHELAGIIAAKGGIDFGEIVDLIPVARGYSGRITLLKIVGTKKEFTIGKELEIRRTLSQSHLYSSAFVVDRSEFNGRIPGRFILHGAGWGHGVGLCQIGAAVMGEKGKKAEEILLHYFKGAGVVQMY